MADMALHHFAKLTAPEINKLKSRALLVMPIASIEQHGQHLATGTDTLINEALQAKLAAKAPKSGDYLFLPTLVLGTSQHHLSFGGTYSITPKLYVQVLIEAIGNFIDQGFHRIVLFNSHGGNHAPMQTALAELANRCEEQGTLLGGFSYWMLCEQMWREKIAKLKDDGVAHACQYETSIMMQAFPEGVREKLRKNSPLPECIQRLQNIAAPFSSLTKTGSIGHPTYASKEIGARLLEIASDAIWKQLVEFRKAAPPKKLK